jgi:hypothetical protein
MITRVPIDSLTLRAPTPIMLARDIEFTEPCSYSYDLCE